MRLSIAIIQAAILCMLLPGISSAGANFYTGTMQVITVSGKACQGQLGNRQVELILRHDKDVIDGFFYGPGITSGKFSGNNVQLFDVHYPVQDELTSAGHFISIEGDGDSLNAELRDRHLEPTDEDCSFDLARMTLVRSRDDNADARFRAAAGLFDAQLLRSQAISQVSSGRYADALPIYEKALELVELVVGDNALQIAPYIAGLSDTYVKLGRIDDFNNLFDQLTSKISHKDERSIFIVHCVHFLLQAGRTSLLKEEYPNALVFFQKAYQLSPQNSEAGAGVMMVYLHTGRLDKAISFLEGALKTMDNELGRQDLSIALAKIYLERALKSDKNGKASEAAADLEKADSINPSSAKYLITLARLRHKSGNLVEAEKILQYGLERFQDESSKQEIIAARDKMHQTETILQKLRKAGG